MVVVGQSRPDVRGGAAQVESSTGEQVGSTTVEESFQQTRTTSGGGGGTAAIVQRQERARQAREIPEVTAEANRVIRDLTSKARQELSRRDLTRQQRLDLKEAFQQQKLDILRRKDEIVSNIKSGGKRELITPKEEFPSVRTGATSVDIAPSRLERIRQKFRSERDVFDETTVGSLTGITGAIGESLFGKAAGKADPQLEKLGKTVGQISPFFVPVLGEALLIGEGVEQLSPERVAKREKELEEGGLSSRISRVLAKGIPLAEIGAGALVGGARLRSKGFRPTTKGLKESPRTSPLGKRAQVTTQSFGKESDFIEINGRFYRKSQLTKNDLVEILRSPQVEKKGKTIIIKENTFADKSSRARTLLNNAKNEKAREKVLDLLKESYGKDFIDDFVSQETLLGRTSLPRKGVGSTPTRRVPSTPKERNEFRVLQARAKNEARIENAKRPIGQRIPLRSQSTPSEFAGTGQYERTDAVLVNKIGELKQTTPKSQILSRSRDIQIENLQQSRLNNIGSALNNLEKQLRQNKLKEESFTRQIQSSTNTVSQQTKLNQLQALKLAQRSLLEQQQSLKNIQRNIPGRRFRLRRIKAPIPFKIPKPKKKAKSGKPSITSTKNPFDVYTRKAGKFRKVKTITTTNPKAQEFLRKRLASTLRASGFIVNRKTGKKIKPTIKPGFRLGKKDKFLLVEKRGRRLDTPTEVRKIQQARKKAKPFKAKKNNMKSTKMIKSRRKA